MSYSGGIMDKRTGRYGKQARKRASEQEEKEKSLELRQAEALERIVELLNELLNFLDERRSPRC